MNPSDYKHIKAWGAIMGSRAYYVENEQRLAAQEGAPLDAVFRDGQTKEWVRVGQCNAYTQQLVERHVKEIA